eukprot:936722-Prorocentrum_minimum.AAC.1
MVTGGLRQIACPLYVLYNLIRSLWSVLRPLGVFTPDQTSPLRPSDPLYPPPLQHLRQRFRGAGHGLGAALRLQAGIQLGRHPRHEHCHFPRRLRQVSRARHGH